MRVVWGSLLIVAVMTAAVAAQSLQTYGDPDKLFTIAHPKGWQVARQSGVSVFTPGDGFTSFSILPTLEVNGKFDSSRFFDSFIVDEQAKHPDLKITSRKSQGANGQGNLEAAWTWSERSTRVQAWGLMAALPVPNANRTAVGFVLYQAPSKDWARVEPVFKRMLQSLTFARQ